jgi:hypothetical protein
LNEIQKLTLIKECHSTTWIGSENIILVNNSSIRRICKVYNLYKHQKVQKMADRMPQAAERLPSKHGTLCSNPNTAKKIK